MIHPKNNRKRTSLITLLVPLAVLLVSSSLATASAANEATAIDTHSYVTNIDDQNSIIVSEQIHDPTTIASPTTTLINQSIKQQQQQQQQHDTHHGNLRTTTKTKSIVEQPTIPHTTTTTTNTKRQTALNANIDVSSNKNQFIWRWDLNHRFHRTNNNNNIPGQYNDNSNQNDNQHPNTDPNNTNSNTNPNNNNSNSNHTPNKPPLILIVQDTTHGPDQEVLYVTSKVNRAYAKRWGFDYLQFTGIAVGGDHSWKGTYNKPYLLNLLLRAKMENDLLEEEKDGNGSGSGGICDDDNGEMGGIGSGMNNEEMSLSEYFDNLLSPSTSATSATSTTTSSSTSSNATTPNCKTKSSVSSYDIVMFLDSSAIIVELDYDILSLIQSNSMMAKSLNTKKDASNNDHIMLWNLNHPLTKDISQEWMGECLKKAESKMMMSTSSSSSSLTSSMYKVQSEAILEKILDNVKIDSLEDGNGFGMIRTSSSSSTFTTTSSSSTSSSVIDNNGNINTNNQIILIDAIPSGMVNGLQGTLVKQDMSYNDYMIEVSDLRRVMPIVTGIADSVCYRFYPQCEIV